MRSFILPVAFALLGMIDFAIAGPTIETTLSRREFSDSCRDISLSGWTLEAQCHGSNGNYHTTSLDLDQCLTNAAGGYIVCQPQDPSISVPCKNPVLRPDEKLVADCETGNGGYSPAIYYLNNCISTNNNGDLTC